jgi:hypothetical protein
MLNEKRMRSDINLALDLYVSVSGKINLENYSALLHFFQDAIVVVNEGYWLLAVIDVE